MDGMMAELLQVDDSWDHTEDKWIIITQYLNVKITL